MVLYSYIVWQHYKRYFLSKKLSLNIHYMYLFSAKRYQFHKILLALLLFTLKYLKQWHHEKVRVRLPLNPWYTILLILQCPRSPIRSKQYLLVHASEAITDLVLEPSGHDKRLYILQLNKQYETVAPYDWKACFRLTLIPSSSILKFSRWGFAYLQFPVRFKWFLLRKPSQCLLTKQISPMASKSTIVWEKLK